MSEIHRDRELEHLQSMLYTYKVENKSMDTENERLKQEIRRLLEENAKLRAYALKAFTVVEFCCGEGLLLSYPHYDCDDLIMEGVDLLNVESSEEARAALGGDA